MSDKHEEVRNGLELLYSTMLTVELMEEYGLKGLEKKYAGMFIRVIEKRLIKAYNELHENDEEFTINAMKYKQDTLKIFAKLGEADAILFAEFAKKFIDNIETARVKGAVYFTKLL